MATDLPGRIGPAESDDPPEYDVAQAFNEVRHARARGGEVMIECDRIARRVARLTARQVPESEWQTSGDVLLTVAASLGPMGQADMPPSVLLNMVGLIGYHFRAAAPARDVAR